MAWGHPCRTSNLHRQMEIRLPGKAQACLASRVRRNLTSMKHHRCRLQLAAAKNHQSEQQQETQDMVEEMPYDP